MAKSQAFLLYLALGRRMTFNSPVLVSRLVLKRYCPFLRILLIKALRSGRPLGIQRIS